MVFPMEAIYTGLERGVLFHNLKLRDWIRIAIYFMSNLLIPTLTDSNIVAAYPQLKERNAAGLFKSIVYNHKQDKNQDGTLVNRVSIARVVQRMDGSIFLLRKSIEADPSQYPLGSEFPKDLFLVEIANPLVSGGEPLMDGQTPVTSNGVPVKRFTMFSGDSLGFGQEIEIAPGLTVPSIKMTPVTLTADIRAPHDSRNRNRATVNPSKGSAESAFNAMDPNED